MYSRTVTVNNPTGLHARPASELVTTAKKFESSIILKKLNSDDPREYNAKSIVRVLSAGLSKGTEIEIQAQGPDEIQAVETLAALIDDGFGE